MHKTKQNTKKSLKNIKSKKSYIISECYNNKYNYLLTDRLRTYLNTYNLTENREIRDDDLRELKRRNKNLNKNCIELVQLSKTKKLDNKFKSKTYEFLWLGSIEKKLDNRLYSIKCNLVNMINNDILTCIDDKNNLYMNMEKQYPKIIKKHFPATFNISNLKKYKFTSKTTYILRPVDSFAGRDILYISSQEELQKAINYYKHTKNYKGVIYNNNVIASEYIINPLLFKGFKFHLRMYYIISYIDSVFNTFFLEEGDILTAEKLYNTDKPFEKAVHDTHQTSSDSDYFFPADLLQSGIITQTHLRKIIKQMRDIMTAVSSILLAHSKHTKHKWLYPEHNNGFIIMGVDFMIDDHLNVKMIEVNNKPGYGYNNRASDIRFSNTFFDWINATILQPYYKLHDITQARTHPTYLPIA